MLIACGLSSLQGLRRATPPEAVAPRPFSRCSDAVPEVVACVPLGRMVLNSRVFHASIQSYGPRPAGEDGADGATHGFRIGDLGGRGGEHRRLVRQTERRRGNAFAFLRLGGSEPKGRVDLERSEPCP